MNYLLPSIHLMVTYSDIADLSQREKICNVVEMDSVTIMVNPKICQ